MEKNETVEKVVEFAQSENKTKIFRPDHPVSDELRKVMVNEVFKDFMEYTWDHYFTACLPILEEYVEDHKPKKEKRQILLKNLFWWKIFYDSSRNLRESCLEDYIEENNHWLSKRPILISWLRECGKAIPKFYFVGHKYTNRVLVLIDMLEEKPLDVIVCDPYAVQSKKGEIVMGTLIPLGGGLFFPINDFYHFDFKARQEIAMHLHYYYDKHLKSSTLHEAFIHVLSAMLQIEKIVSSDNREKTAK